MALTVEEIIKQAEAEAAAKELASAEQQQSAPVVAQVAQVPKVDKNDPLYKALLRAAEVNDAKASGKEIPAQQPAAKQKENPPAPQVEEIKKAEPVLVRSRLYNSGAFELKGNDDKVFYVRKYKSGEERADMTKEQALNLACSSNIDFLKGYEKTLLEKYPDNKAEIAGVMKDLTSRINPQTGSIIKHEGLALMQDADGDNVSAILIRTQEKSPKGKVIYTQAVVDDIFDPEKPLGKNDLAAMAQVNGGLIYGRAASFAAALDKQSGGDGTKLLAVKEQMQSAIPVQSKGIFAAYWENGTQNTAPTTEGVRKKPVITVDANEIPSQRDGKAEFANAGVKPSLITMVTSIDQKLTKTI